MIVLALRNLTKDRGRLALSISAIGLALTLMMMLSGIFHGSLARDVKYIQEIDADLFVFAKGTAAYYQVSTPLSMASLQKLRHLQEVADVTPVYTVRAALESGGRTFSLYISGYDPADVRSGPWAVISGHRLIRDNQIVLPTKLASRLSLGVGDVIRLSGSSRPFEIAALVPEASSFGRHHSWVTERTASELYPLPGYATFALVRLSRGAPIAQAIAAMKAEIPSASVNTKAEQLALARDFQADSFSPVLNAMTIIAATVATLIVGIVLYSFVHERRRELGVLLAIGFQYISLICLIFLQSFMLLFVSFVVALMLTGVASRTMVTLLEFPFLLGPQAVGSSFLQTVVIALIAAIPSVRFITSVEPSEAFR
ncbi:MAG: ABC transporter permease [Fimbriimonadales bacterium]